MSSFAKLDSGIVDSTLWMQPHDVLRVWIAMMAKASPTGFVRASVPAMAHLCMVPIERLEQILQILTSPDPYSRTAAEEGRRLRIEEGGWQIINYLAYRNARDEGARREYQREWDRKHRPSGHNRGQSDSPTSVRQSDTGPTESDAVRQGPTKAEAEEEADQEQKQLASLAARERKARDNVPADLPVEVEPERWRLFEEHHHSQRKWSVSRLKTAVGQLRQIAAQGEIDPNDVLEWATARGLADLRDAAQRMTADADWLARRSRAGPSAHGPPLSKTGAAFAALNLSADSLDPTHAQRHAAAMVSRSDSTRLVSPAGFESGPDPGG